MPSSCLKIFALRKSATARTARSVTASKSKDRTSPKTQPYPKNDLKNGPSKQKPAHHLHNLATHSCTRPASHIPQQCQTSCGNPSTWNPKNAGFTGHSFPLGRAWIEQCGKFAERVCPGSRARLGRLAAFGQSSCGKRPM